MSWARYRSQWYSSLISTHRIILTNQPDWPKIVPILHWFWNAILWWKKGKLLWTDFFHFVFHNCLDIWIIYTQRFCHIFLTQIGMSYKSKSIFSATYRHFLLDSMCLSWCQINPEKVWKILVEIQLTRFGPIRTREWKVPCLMKIRFKSEK